ncbi:MAG: TlpA family protein disulfide reductase [Sarcina sp.]
MFKLIFLILIAIVIGFVILSLIVFNRDVNNRIKNRTVLKSIKIDSKTINNQPINNDLFLKNKITMVNIWGTYCGSCIKELKDLQEIYDEFQVANVGVLGIIFDVNDELKQKKALEKAVDVLQKNQITYPNILLDDNLKEEIKDKVFFVPTTIFVDKNGKVIGNIIENACSKAEYIEKIEEILNGTIKNEYLENEQNINLKCDINGICDKEEF